MSNLKFRLQTEGHLLLMHTENTEGSDVLFMLKRAIKQVLHGRLSTIARAKGRESLMFFFLCNFVLKSATDKTGSGV